MSAGRVISTAGRVAPTKPGAAKREAIAKIRQALRDTASKDEDVDDALDALIELARSED